MLSHARALAPLALALTLAGCGVRTSLDLFDDGAVPPRPDGAVPFDGGAFDAGGASCRRDAECDDGRVCNGVELCVAGRCEVTSRPVCEDGISCTVDECIEGVGCVSRPDDALCGPGGRCDPAFGCSMRRCGSDDECDDRLACNGFEVCGPGGVCESVMPPFCDDGIACTIDRCREPDGRCEAIPDDSLCGIGRACDPMVGCVAARCSGDADCDDGTFCNGIETCGPDGVCQRGTPVVCPDDGIACTREFCDEAARGACAVRPDSSLCPRGELCSPVPGDPDGCRRIECMTDAQCDDGSVCNGIERCLRNVCRRGAPLECPPEDECLVVSCSDAAGGCIGQPRAERELCGNGIEDDCDGLRDCEDPDCRATPACACVPVAPTELRCTDGTDDDCDGLVDCADPECAMTPVCLGQEVFCANGADDDGDGLPDCLDPDCFADFRCRDAGPVPLDAGPPPGDGGIVDRELGIPACTNGIDDDRDGRTDCDDPDCRPFGPGSECCNGIDDNPGDDTPEDVFTCRCFDDSICAGVSPFEQVCYTRASFFVCAPRCNFYGGDAWCRMFDAGLNRCDAVSGQCVP